VGSGVVGASPEIGIRDFPEFPSLLWDQIRVTKAGSTTGGPYGSWAVAAWNRASLEAYASCTIWRRLPQVSSKTAVVTLPISVGFWVNFTPFDSSRSNSA
jgi:hypothetical protein